MGRNQPERLAVSLRPMEHKRNEHISILSLILLSRSPVVLSTTTNNKTHIKITHIKPRVLVFISQVKVSSAQARIYQRKGITLWGKRKVHDSPHLYSRAHACSA